MRRLKYRIEIYLSKWNSKDEVKHERLRIAKTVHPDRKYTFNEVFENAYNELKKKYEDI